MTPTPETPDEWDDLRKCAKAATPSLWNAFQLSGNADVIRYIAAANPATILRLIDAARAQAPPSAPSEERIYPCDKCGKKRTKAEGGTVFTVCDACWDDRADPDPDDNRGEEVERLRVELMARTTELNHEAYVADKVRLERDRAEADAREWERRHKMQREEIANLRAGKPWPESENPTKGPR